MRQFLALNDLADDGKSNSSLKQVPKTQSGQVDRGHACTLLFSDGKGPDARPLIWNFFKQFSR